jgi:hypothetical protein
MQNIILGLIVMVAAAGATMTGIGIFIGIPLFLFSCFLIFKGILQVGWGAAKLGAKGAKIGVNAMKDKK